MRTHNTFLEFSEEPSMIEKVHRLRRWTSEPNGNIVRGCGVSVPLCNLSPVSDRSSCDVTTEIASSCDLDKRFRDRYGSAATTATTTTTADNLAVVADSSSPPVLKKKNPHKIFVGSLPAIVNEEYLASFMAQFGKVKSVAIKRNLVTQQSRRYGFVTFVHNPNPVIYRMKCYVGGKQLRIEPYESNPSWKNAYASEDELDNDCCSGCSELQTDMDN